ncbi:branched-chain amino acid ABC transporter permease [Paracoccus suum]|uniref:Branched-chain amino acid ABC transporter permease n=1 Tax=Paracoccus suum TaxID=2259340 RepID=A0A344PG23_9RHOB|nr:branched-chain amino acid ABC transporter permease [Paracoccus suum]AXC48328.1 branched-chain amino acid ABC transporter permease [Paracoccus suum]
MLNLFALQLLNGVQYGLLLFLIAAGLTLILGIMDVVNLGHGVLYMLGAFLMVSATAATGNFWLGLLLVLPATLLIGLVLERLLFRPLYARSHLDQVLATFGLVLAVTEVCRMIWGNSPLSVAMPTALSGSVPLIAGVQFPVYRLVIIGTGLAVALGLYLVIGHTRIGMRLRAGATHRGILSALGVDVGRLFALVFAFGAMLAGFAGAIVAPLLSVDTGMGEAVLITTFVVVVIGGIGSVRGAFVAALLVGSVDTLGRSFGPLMLAKIMDPATAAQAGRTLAPMLVYLLMAAILAVRPAGLFGRPA